MSKKKLNIGKAQPRKRGGIFKKKFDRPTKRELQELIDYYKKHTAAISDNEAMEMLYSPETWHYLTLLSIADFYRPMGKTFAILTAFKLGYMAGKDGAGHEKN